MTEAGRCPYCGGEIQELTVICRHCGKNVRKAGLAPGQVKPAGAPWQLWGALLVLMAFVLMILWVFGGRSSSDRTTATIVTKPGLQGAVETALGEGNRAVERARDFRGSSGPTGQVYVEFAINDNFSEDLIIGGAQLDCMDVLKAIAKSDASYGSVRIVGTFPMKDAFGNVVEQEVVRLDFEAATVRKINWSGFSYKNIYTVADKAEIHAQFRP